MQILATRLVAAAIVVCLLSATGCGDKVKQKPERQPATMSESAERDKAQDLLDAAANMATLAGTGKFAVDVGAFGHTFNSATGEYDLDKPALQATLVVEIPEEERADSGGEEEFRLRSRVFDDDAYMNVSAGPFAPCWFHMETGTDLGEGILSNIQVEPVHPAMTVLLGPKATGFVKGKSDEIVAEVRVDQAVALGLPRIVFQREVPLPADLMMPVRFRLDRKTGSFEGVTVRMADALKATASAGIDLADSERTKEQGAQAEKSFSAIVFGVTYSDFGSDVTVKRPAADLLMDRSDQADSRLCAAAGGGPAR